MEWVCSVTGQRRVDASFTWQLQGSSDVSESAEALIRTKVNHCSGNPEETEGCLGRSKPREWAAAPRGACGATVKECWHGDINTCLFIALSDYQLIIIINKNRSWAGFERPGSLCVSVHEAGAAGAGHSTPLNGRTSEKRATWCRICAASTQQYPFTPLSWGVNNSKGRGGERP